jgi:HEAT repeat protein
MIEPEMLKQIIEKCQRGNKRDIDDLLGLLTNKVDLTIRKNIDFRLGGVTNPEGLARLEYYLFHGSQIQRNYATLFFARRDEWALIHRAYRLGLIDYRQAYSR